LVMRILLRRAIAQSALWRLRVLLYAPLFGYPPRMRQALEPLLGQAFVTEPRVRALDIGVLDWLARAYERQLNHMMRPPGNQTIALNLRAVVHCDGGRKAAVVGEPLEHSGQASSRDRGVDLDRRTLVAAVVDNRQAAQPTPIG